MRVGIDRVRTRGELHSFVTLPWRLYGSDPHWIPPLIGETKKTFDAAKNPFFSHGEIALFLARRAGRPAGRIAAIRDRAHETFQQEAVGFFGFFECEDDPEVAAALIRAAAEFASAEGLERLRGPVNPSMNDECGLLVDGFDTPPMIMMPHGHPYYDGLLRSSGLEKARDLVAYIVEDYPIVERLARGARIAEKRNPGVNVRCIDMKRLDEELVRVKHVYNRAWERNWGFVPMTDAEIDHMARQLKPVLDPRLVLFAERGGEPIAFALALPDVNQAIRHANGRLFPLGWARVMWEARKIRRLRVLALGLVPEARRRGIDMLLYHALNRNSLERGYRCAELSWILEDNEAIRTPIETMGARVYKRMRIYEGHVDVLLQNTGKVA
jgi:GNAT superfamily N-acetyltransferase